MHVLNWFQEGCCCVVDLHTSMLIVCFFVAFLVYDTNKYRLNNLNVSISVQHTNPIQNKNTKIGSAIVHCATFKKNTQIPFYLFSNSSLVLVKLKTTFCRMYGIHNEFMDREIHSTYSAQLQRYLIGNCLCSCNRIKQSIEMFSFK